MPLFRKFVFLCLCLTLGGLLPPQVLAQPDPAPHQPAREAGAARALAGLAEAFQQARCRFDPLQFGTINGDNRYDDQLGLSIAPRVRERQFARYRALQKQLAAIPRAALAEPAQLTYDLLAFELDSALALQPYPEHLLPLNQLDNVPSILANYANGAGSQPLATVRQYDAYLNRLRQLPRWIDQAISNMREGIRIGVVQPRAITQAMLPQFRALRSATAEDSVFYTPVLEMPARFPPSDRRRLRAAWRHTLARQLLPALDRLSVFLAGDYLAASRASTGWSALPDGKAWYLARVQQSTNLPLDPDAVHALGLQEVARIRAEMAALAPRLGYDGPLDGLPQWVAARAEYRPFASDAEVLHAYEQIDASVQAQLPAYFTHIPKAPLSLQLEPALTRATASDHYTPSAADGSHPGVFWAVVNDPNTYSRVGMVSLFLHEGVPGHHLHAALLKELDLPDFRKFSTENQNSAAYTEGWALYCETLGKEFGLYEDPVAYYGHLNAEMLRAARLVVDTGMHAKGWTREQSIAYLRETLGWGEEAARNQIERYMAWPGQALAYKTGALKILELRARAQAALGERFSLRDFHAVVMDEGTQPLPILEARVNRWIAAAH